MVEKAGGPLMLMIVLAVMLMFPMLMEPAFAVGMLLMWWLSKRKFHLPLRMPKSSRLKDYNDPSPNPADKGGPSNAGGIVFIGNEMETNKELWVNAADSGTHFLVFGTTGAGKAIRDDEPVHTPQGWVRADALKVGDEVSTADGKTAPIVGVFEQGQRPMYRLVLDDGRTAEVSDEHLWAVQPFRRSSPLVAEPTLTNEVISTVELRDRLGQADSAGWALPLPEAAPGEDAAWGTAMAARVGRAARALTGEMSFPDAPESGSARQRMTFWQEFLAMAHMVGLCRSVGRAHRFEPMPAETAQAVVALARSLGRWAKIEAEDGSVLVLDGARQVRIVRVEKLQQSASCRCIKLDDPRGLFLIHDYIVTHNTETLISLAYNALVHGSGFIYVDGKGDNSLFMKLFSMTRATGRHDDLLCINYMTGGRDVVGPQEDKLSNSLNPFISGTAGSLTQLLVSLMPSAGGGDGGMWQGRAVSFIGSLMMALTHLRNVGLMQLGVSNIREYLTLEKVQEMAKRADLPAHIITSLESYLHSLPGYQANAEGGKQGEITTEQHGYLQMQFSRIMSSLADDYGYIFNTSRGEVDFFDVVLNNRILTVLLPSLEKSPEELGNLGKIIVASLKSMMATGLGDRVEGEVSVIIDSKASHAPSPFMCILDEYGYYVVAGAAVMPAQARSLNFSMVFAGQDYSSFKKNNNKEEAEATVANCNMLVFMKTVDSADTGELFLKSVGKARVASASGYQRSGGGYFDSGNAQIQMEDRGDLQDLRDQGPGQAHVIFKSTLVRTKMFYADPPKVKHIRLNHFLRVEPTSAADIQMLDQDMKVFSDKLAYPDRLNEMALQHPLPENLQLTSATIDQAIKRGRSPLEAGLAGLMALNKLPNATVQKFAKRGAELLKDGNATPQDDVLNIFAEDDVLIGPPKVPTGLHPSAPLVGTPPGSHTPEHYMSDSYDQDDDGDDDLTDHDLRVGMSQHEMEDHIYEGERASGATHDEAQARSTASVDDIASTTSYPTQKPTTIDESDFDKLLGDLYTDMGDDLALGDSSSQDDPALEE